ncbi:MAG: DUF4209 domain-containing protein [Candidatus Paceibacterota bacterium]
MEFKSLSELFKHFEEKEELFDEDDIDSALRKLSDENDDTNNAVMAEKLAFGFYADPNQNHIWGTYYGPKMIMPNKDGQYIESPSIKFVNKDVIEYWKERALNSSHPILKLRYNDLLWDFSQTTVNEKPSYKHAQEAILATIELIESGNYEHVNLVSQKLDRALQLALSLNNSELIEKIKKCYLSLYKKEKNKTPFFINHLFEKMIVENKSLLSVDEEKYIISETENNLRLSVETSDIFEAEIYSFNLADYYRRNEDFDNAKRSITEYQKSIEKTIDTNSALVVSSYLKKLYDKYVEFGFNQEANSLDSLLHKSGVKSVESMGVFEHQFQIPTKLIDNFISNVVSGKFDKIVEKIVAHFLPNKNVTEQQVTDLAQKTAIQALVSQTIHDKDGRILAQVGPVHEDLLGRTVRQLYQNMSFESYFLRGVLDKFFSQINNDIEKILKHCTESPVYDEDTIQFLKEGLKKYIEKDHFACIHIFIPLIEKCLRSLLKINGSPIYKPGRHGGLFLRNLGEILDDDIIKLSLGDDIIFYLKVLLIDQRGWNLRNDISHGILEYEDFRIEIADRLFHVLLLLSLIRLKEKGE